MTNEQDAAKILANLATVIAAAAAADKTRAEADKIRANSDKTREEADQVRANNEKLRVETGDLRALSQNKLSVAQADLEAKQLANQRTQQDNSAERVDKLIKQATGAIPDISSLPKNTVTFHQGAVLREGEAVTTALDEAARNITAAVTKAIRQHPEVSEQAPTTLQHLQLVSNPNLLADITRYHELSCQAEAVTSAVETAKTEATDLLPTAPGGDGNSGLATVETGLVLASVAGAVAKQVASLFETEIAATTNTGTIAASTVHAAIAHHLLNREDSLKLAVHHEHARVPAGSPLLNSIAGLIRDDLELAKLDARLTLAISTHQPDADRVAEAKKKRTAAVKVKDDPASSDEERAAANAAITEADTIIRDLAESLDQQADLQDVQAGLRAIMERLKTLVTLITTTPTSGVSPLAAAVAVESIALGMHVTPPARPNLQDQAKSGKKQKDGSETTAERVWVLIAGPASVESNQLVITRRIFSPRVHTSVALFIDYFLINGEQLFAANRSQATVAYTGKLKFRKPGWKVSEPLPRATVEGTG